MCVLLDSLGVLGGGEKGVENEMILGYGYLDTELIWSEEKERNGEGYLNYGLINMYTL